MPCRCDCYVFSVSNRDKKMSTNKMQSVGSHGDNYTFLLSVKDKKYIYIYLSHCFGSRAQKLEGGNGYVVHVHSIELARQQET